MKTFLLLIVISFGLVTLIYIYENFDQILFAPGLPAPTGNGAGASPEIQPLGTRDSVVRPPVTINSARPRQIGLTSQVQAGEKINLTGWRLQGNHGAYFIPPAVDVFEPESQNEPQDLYLGAGERVNIYSGPAPLSRNLRLNVCLGYLDQSLAQNCPFFQRQEIQHLAGGCQNFIISLTGCRLPPPNPAVALNDACAQFLNQINYKSCFYKHRPDDNFLSREWRLWEMAEFLDELHDVVRLYDREGKLADEYVY